MSVHASPSKKLNKQFLAELEKDFYKTDDINNTQNYSMQSNKKEITKTTDNSCLITSTSQSVTPLRMAAVKMTNTKSINGAAAAGSAVGSSRYEANVYNNYEFTPNFLQKSLNQSHSSNLNDTNSLVSQIWLEQTQKNSNLQQPTAQVYGNNAVVAAQSPLHGFVAIANRPASMIQNDTRNTNYGSSTYSNQQGVSAPSNIYNSIAGDIYSTIAGDLMYDTVSATPINNVSHYGTLPRSSQQQQFDEYNNLNLYNNVQPPVIYDEVANEELLRPIRPAPMAPTTNQQAQPQLSNQQIQRRLEKLAQQEQQIGGLMMELGEDATEQDAKDALEAVGWDHTLAVRYYKVERLFR
jgi:hypothetical protein